MRALPVVAALVLVSLLSGCSGSDGAGQAATPADPDGPTVDPDEYKGVPTGLVHGLVADDEYLPIKDAAVRLSELGVRDVTDGQGTFDFVDVPQGTYTLVVERAGYFTKTVGLEVTGGETAAPKVFLEYNPFGLSYVDTSVEIAGRIQCMTSALTLDACGTATGSSENFLNWHLGAHVAEVLVEVDWDPSLDVTDQLKIRMYTFGTDGNHKNLQPTTELPRPIRLSYTNADLADIDASHDNLTQFATEGEEITTGVYAGAYSGAGAAGMAVDQSFTFYATQFYGDPMPEGYTRLAP